MNPKAWREARAEVRGRRSGFLWRISGIEIVAGWSLFITFALIAIDWVSGGSRVASVSSNPRE